MEILEVAMESDNLAEGLENHIFLDLAQNYAKIFPEDYYIEIEDNKNIKVYTPDGAEIYTDSHSLEKLIEKKDGEIVYQVTCKSSVDLMIEEYGKTQIQKIIGIPPEVMTTHKKVQTIEKIIEIPSEVVIEKEVPYEVEVQVEREIDAFQQKISEKFKDLPEIKLPINSPPDKLSTSFLKDAANMLLRKSDEYRYNRLFAAKLSHLRNIEVFNKEIDTKNLYGMICSGRMSKPNIIQDDYAVIKLGHSSKLPTLPTYKGYYLDTPDCIIFISLLNEEGIYYLKLHDIVELSLGSMQDYLIV